MKLVTADEAVGLIEGGATIIVGRSRAGQAVAFIDALASGPSRLGQPETWTTVTVVRLGDFDQRGDLSKGLARFLEQRTPTFRGERAARHRPHSHRTAEGFAHDPCG